MNSAGLKTVRITTIGLLDRRKRSTAHIQQPVVIYS